VLLLDKPAGISSNTALQRAKFMLRAEKAGHTGTLDPLATGLLPICLGEATKFSAAMLDAGKSYLGVIQFGVRTTTGDADGEMLERHAVDFGQARLREVLGSFQGLIQQVPPAFSALKHHGKPLYDYARKGIAVEREPRQ
jgi:tRNA pseudouridine55 synthase